MFETPIDALLVRRIILVKGKRDTLPTAYAKRIPAVICNWKMVPDNPPMFRPAISEINTGTTMYAAPHAAPAANRARKSLPMEKARLRNLGRKSMKPRPTLCGSDGASATGMGLDVQRENRILRRSRLVTLSKARSKVRHFFLRAEPRYRKREN